MNATDPIPGQPHPPPPGRPPSGERRPTGQLRETQQRLDQRYAEQQTQFREAAERYRQLVEGLPAEYIFYYRGRDGQLKYVSPSVQEILGYPPEQILRTTFQPHFTDSPLNARLEQQLADALAGRTSGHHDCELRHADGGTRIMEYLIVPVFDDQGQVVAVEGLARDVTARRQAEAQLRQTQQQLEGLVQERTGDLRELNLQLWEEIQLREQAEEEVRRSEERFRNVVEDQTEFIVRWLPDGTRTFVNSSYCRFFGQPPEALLGQSFFPLIRSEEERELVRQRTRCLTPENPVASYEHQVLRPDGSVAWTQWNDRAIFDAGGRIVEFQSVGRDITAQREADERLQQQQEELTHAARLSTMGEMVAAFGHELGHPLQSIANYAWTAELALRAERPDSLSKALELTEKISAEAARTTELLKRLRDFTRRSPPRREPLDLNRIVLQAVELMAADLRRRRVATATAAGGRAAGGARRPDPDRAGAGEPAAECGGCPRARVARRPADHDPHRSGRRAGLRRGLRPGCRNDRRRNGQSVPGVLHDQAGRLGPGPVAQPPDHRRARRAADAGPQRRPRDDLHVHVAGDAMTALLHSLVYIVDDDRVLRDSVAAMLGEMGVAAKTYPSAESFLDDYDGHRPGCLLTDVRMLGMSGVELLEKLARDGVSLAVVVLTGYADTPTTVRAIKGGAITLLEKPCSSRELWDAIRQALLEDAERHRREQRVIEIRGRVESLTPAERKVLDCMVQGDSNKRMSKRLRVSVRTIEVRRQHVFQKMQTDSLAQLVRLYLEAFPAADS